MHDILVAVQICCPEHLDTTPIEDYHAEDIYILTDCGLVAGDSVVRSICVNMFRPLAKFL